MLHILFLSQCVQTPAEPHSESVKGFSGFGNCLTSRGLPSTLCVIFLYPLQ